MIFNKFHAEDYMSNALKHLNNMSIKTLVFCIIIIFAFNCICCSDQSMDKSFIIAVKNRDYTVMNELLKKGASINSIDENNNFSALTIASSENDMKLVEFLLENGAMVQRGKKYPNQPIYFAIANNNPKIFKRLLDSGIDPNYAWPGSSSGTLLTNAAQFGHLEIVKMLYDNNVDVNDVGNGNFTPLYRTIIYDHFDVMEYLLTHGAKLNEKDVSALEQIKWFEIKENKKIISLLESKNAISNQRKKGRGSTVNY